MHDYLIGRYTVLRLEAALIFLRGFAILQEALDFYETCYARYPEDMNPVFIRDYLLGTDISVDLEDKTLLCVAYLPSGRNKWTRTMIPACDYEAEAKTLNNVNTFQEVDQSEDDFWQNTFAIYFSGQHDLLGDTKALSDNIEDECNVGTSYTANHINIHTKWNDILYAKILSIIKAHNYEISRLDKNDG